MSTASAIHADQRTVKLEGPVGAHSTWGVVMTRIALFYLFAAFTFNSAYAWSPLGPNTFDDCILESMKGVTSDMAAQAIYRSCKQKFPDSAPQNSSGSVSACIVTYSGGKFIKGRPSIESDYVAITFGNTDSMAYVPARLKDQKESIVKLLKDNEGTIVKYCPDINLHP